MDYNKHQVRSALGLLAESRNMAIWRLVNMWTTVLRNQRMAQERSPYARYLSPLSDASPHQERMQ